MRRKVIWAAVAIPASFYLLAFMSEGFPHYAEKLRLSAMETVVSRGISILIAMAIGLGVINLFSIHGANILRRRPDWPFSILVFASFALVSGAMLWQYHQDAQRRALDRQTEMAWKRLAEAQRISSTAERDQALAQLTSADWEAIRRRRDYEDQYRFEPRAFYINAVNIPLTATVMALLGFYITYAAYRAFRIRSAEATVMMVSAAVVILGSDAFGAWLTGGWLARAAEFDNGVLNSGMQRGLLLGIGVAVMGASLRIFLGFERGIVEVQQPRD